MERYRYGFNGKENDNEAKGEGNQQDYGMRVYDPRVGRFLSVDPLQKKFAYYTPYQFAGNTPIQAIDLDGLEPLQATNIQGSRYKDNSIKIATEVKVKIQIINLSSTEISKSDLYDFSRNLRGDLTNLLSGTHTQSNFPISQTTENGKLKPLNQPVQANLTYDVQFNANVSVVDSKDQLDNNAIVFAIVDGYYLNKEPAGLAESRYSRVSSGEAKYFSDYSLKQKGQELILHEVLHNLGADDIYDPKDLNKVKTPNIMNSLKYSKKELTPFQKVTEIFTGALGPWSKLWNAANKKKSVENSYSTPVKSDLDKFIKDNNVQVKQ